jgi:hypothetical protein
MEYFERNPTVRVVSEPTASSERLEGLPSPSSAEVAGAQLD